MRTPGALLAVGVAAALGTLTGALVLPDREPTTVATPGPNLGSSTPSASRASPSSPGALSSPAPSSPASPSDPASATPDSDGGDAGPLRTADLLTTADFRTAGITVSERPAENRMELVVCRDHQTLDDVAESGPPVQRSWESGSVTAAEQAITTGYDEEAPDVAARVLSTLAGCQKAAPGRWVYGPTHTERLGPDITASWLGEVDGSLNTTGRAPAGEPINGGTAVLRHGLRVAVLTISWCAGAGEAAACVVADDDAGAQLTALSRAAALRLGAT